MIEVLVTLLLSVIVMTLTLQVMGTLRPKQNTQTDAKDVISSEWIDPLFTQLSIDLTHAANFEIGKNKLSVVTYYYIDPKTFLVSHRPARVTYQIIKTGKISTLSRHQDLIGKRTNAKPLKQFIAMDITDFEISAGQGIIDTSENKTMPKQFTLKLSYLLENKRQTLERTIIRP